MALHFVYLMHRQVLSEMCASEDDRTCMCVGAHAVSTSVRHTPPHLTHERETGRPKVCTCVRQAGQVQALERLVVAASSHHLGGYQRLWLVLHAWWLLCRCGRACSSSATPRRRRSRRPQRSGRSTPAGGALRRTPSWCAHCTTAAPRAAVCCARRVCAAVQRALPMYFCSACGEPGAGFVPLYRAVSGGHC